MSGNIMTIISGFALLTVFGLVYWNLQRKRAHREKTGGTK